MSKETNRRRLLAAVSLIALAVLFLTNPLTRLMYRGMKESTMVIAMRGFVAPLHMALLVASVFGIMQVLRPRADRMGLVGGALTVMGWAVGIRIIGLGQIEALLTSGVAGVPADALRKSFEAAPIVWRSMVPMGILFPAGMITLGLTLLITRPIPRVIGAVLVMGGVLFPLGRIGIFRWALAPTDILLGIAFALIGWQIWTRPELWSAAEEPMLPAAEAEPARAWGSGSSASA